MTHRSDKLEKKVEEKLHEVKSPRSRYFTKPMPFDIVFQYTLLPLIPSWVAPNYITFLRYLAIPFVVYFLVTGQLAAGLVLFAVAALSDALDGAMARTRRQITDWGILNDPLADKLLIGSVALVVIWRFVSPWLAGLIIGIELLLVVSAYHRYKGKVVPAKTVGKIKMVLQSLGVAILLLGAVIQMPVLVTVATYTLYAAVVFAVLSLFVYRSI